MPRFLLTLNFIGLFLFAAAIIYIENESGDAEGEQRSRLSAGEETGVQNRSPEAPVQTSSPEVPVQTELHIVDAGENDKADHGERQTSRAHPRLT